MLLLASTGNAYVTTPCTFELSPGRNAEQAERTETGVRLRVVESENDLEKKI